MERAGHFGCRNIHSEGRTLEEECTEGFEFGQQSILYSCIEEYSGGRWGVAVNMAT